MNCQTAFDIAARIGQCGAPALLILLILSTAAHAQQWTVVYLHPAGATGHSYAYRVQDGHQVGAANVGGIDQASLWTGSAASWVSLHPTGATASAALDVHGGQQVGYATVGGVNRARLWSGSAGSWVSLHPNGASESVARGMTEGQQVGYARFNNVDHAGLWGGTANSWVDLHPGPGALASYANDTHAGQQVGVAYYIAAPFGPSPQAGLWSGSASSWVGLYPISIQGSNALDVHDGQQVGFAFNAASLWSGTAGSWVDLTPAGAPSASAYGVHDGRQVGAAYIGGASRAGVWSGAAASFINLHAYLPADFTWSSAQGVWQEGGAAQVVGYGYNNTTARIEALMWLETPCDPCDVNCDGSLNTGDIQNLVDLLIAGGVSACAPCAGDVNGDGAVNGLDIQLFVDNLLSGNSC